MTSLRIAALAAFMLMTGTFAAAQDAPPAFQDLVAKAEAGETVDFTALRHAFVQWDAYDGYGREVRPMFNESWPAFRAKDCAKVEAVAAKMLKLDYTNSTVHIIRGECLKMTGDEAGAAREKAIGQGLFDSLIHSGNGRAADTAFEVVTMSEETLVLTLLGIEEAKQSLVENGGRQFDVIVGKDEKTGEEKTVWFNVDALFFGQMRAFKKAGMGQ